MKYIVFLFGIAVLSACAAPKSKEIFTSDGEKAYSIACTGDGLSWSSCYEKASEICSTKGYEILTQSSEEIVPKKGLGQRVALGLQGFGAGLSGEGQHFLDRQRAGPRPVVHRSMIIKCKE